MNDWEMKIKEHCDEEAKDRNSYLELAEAAESKGHHKAAGILRDIAHDEKTHHTMLQHILHMEEE